MGVKTTHYIKRSVALEIFEEKVKSSPTNKELEDILESFEEESQFRNYIVVEDDTDISDQMFTIDSKYQF